MPNLKPLRICFYFILLPPSDEHARERISVKMDSTESRFIIAPSNNHTVWGDVCVCVCVCAFLSPEILQAVAVKGLKTCCLFIRC